MSSDTPLQSTVASSEHQIISVLGQKAVIMQFPGVKAKIHRVCHDIMIREYGTLYTYSESLLL